MSTFREDLHLGHKVPLIETDDLMDGSITASKIARKAIQWWHIACNAIRNCHISDKAVDNRTMDDDSVDERVLVDGLVERIMQPAIDDLQNQINSLWAGGAWISINLSRESITMGETTSVTVTVSTTVSANTITVKMGNTVIGTGEGLGWEGTVTLTPESTTKIIFTAEAEIGDEGKKITSSKALVVNAKVANIYWGDGKITEWPATMVDLFGDEFPLPTLIIGEGVDSSKIEYSAVNPVTGEPATDIVGFGNSKNYKTIEFRHEGDALIVATYTDAGTTVTASYTLHLSKADATNLVYWQEWVLSSKTYAYTTDAEAEDRVIHLIQKTIKTIDSFTFEVSSSRITYDTSNNTVTLPELCASASGEKEVFTVKAKIENDDYYNDLEIPCYVILNKVSPGYEWTPRRPITVTLGQQATYPQLTPKPLDVTVVYSSSNPPVVSVDNYGIPTPHNASTVPVIISASNASTEKYLEHEATYSLTVQEQVQSNFYWTVNGAEHSEGEELSHIVTSEQPIIRLEKGNYNVSKVEYYMMYSSGYNIMSYLNSYLQLDANYQLTLPTGLYNYNYSTGEWDTVSPSESKQYKIIAYVGGHQDSNTGQWVGYLKKAELQLKLIKGNWVFDWSSKTDKVISISQVDANNVIPSSLLPTITGVQYSDIDTIVDLRGDESYVKVTKGTGRNYEVKAFQPTDELSEVTDSFGQVVVPAGFVRIRATANYDASHKARSVSYNLKITPPDYYVGWATGENADYDVIEEMDGADLVPLSKGYNTASNPSKTKTITQGDLVGDFQILFVMWKTSNPPVSGAFYGGIAEEQLVASDFLNANKFPAQSNVTINGDTFHLAGRGGSYEAGQYLKVNF